MPEISIIIPVYNVEKYLFQCLDSICKQTFCDFEVIIVDDGSPDNSQEIYKDFCLQDKRFNYIKQDNSGVAKARNAGLKMASGKYILLIDSDDWMPADALENLYYAAKNSDSDMVIGDVWIEYGERKREYVHIFKNEFCTEDREFIENYRKSILAYNENPLPYGDGCILPTGLGGIWNKLIRNEIINQSNIEFNPSVKGIFDDCLFSLEVLEHVNKICYIKKPVYNYRMVPTSLVHKYRENTLEVNACIFDEIQKSVLCKGTAKDFETSFAFYIVRRFIESIGTYFFAKDNPNSFVKKIHILRETVDKEPYNKAFHSANLKGLNKTGVAIAKFARYKMIFLIFLVYSAKEIKKSVQRI